VRVAEEEVGYGGKGGGRSFAAANTGFFLLAKGRVGRGVGEVHEDLRVGAKCFIRNFVAMVI